MEAMRRVARAVVAIIRSHPWEVISVVLALLALIVKPSPWVGIAAVVFVLVVIIIANHDEIIKRLRNLFGWLRDFQRGIVLLAGVFVGASLAVAIVFWPILSETIIELLRPTPPVVRYDDVALQTHHGTFISAMPEQDGWDWELWAEKDMVQDWEKFRVLYLDNGRVALKTYHGRFVSPTRDKGCCNWLLRAEKTKRGRPEEFTLIQVGDEDDNMVVFKTYLGRYVSATDAEQSWKVRAETEDIDLWEIFEFVTPTPVGTSSD